jgi:hypothetical protein
VWKISGLLRQPQISIDTGTRYLTETRDKATDPAINRNPDQTLPKLMSPH